MIKQHMRTIEQFWNDFCMAAWNWFEWNYVFYVEKITSVFKSESYVLKVCIDIDDM